MSLTLFSEGGNTEPDYFRDFAVEWGNKLVILRIVGGAGVPLTLVQAAIREKVKLDAVARASPNSFDRNFQVWVVCDRDNHPNFTQAMTMARQGGVKVADSNPCFELWALLHFRDQDAHIHRHQAQKDLRRLMPSYDPKRGKRVEYDLLRPRYPDARRRAKTIHRRRIEERIPGGNPSTRVHDLLEIIVQNGSSRLSKK